MKFLTSELKWTIFLKHLYLFKYIAMIVNATVVNTYKLLCCFQDPLYQLCYCVISPVTFGRSFNDFEP